MHIIFSALPSSLSPTLTTSRCVAEARRPYAAEDGRILRSSSNDGGVTWTPVEPTRLKTPNSGFDAVKLSDGRVVLTHNFKSLGTLRRGRIDFPP